MRPIAKFLWRRFQGDIGVWGTCREFLVTTVGTYCSYCEVPLGVNLPIEHKAPKSEDKNNPLKASHFDYNNRYGNFLLACPMCNSWKGPRPSVEAGEEFYHTYEDRLEGLDPYAPGSAYWLSLATMVWPDRLLPGFAWDVPAMPEQLKNFLGYPDPTLQLFRYVRGPASAAALAAEGLLRFPAKQSAPPWATVLQDEVWVRPAPHLRPEQLARVRNTIQVLNLNYSNPTEPGGADRRVASRTQAWFMAGSVLNTLAQAVRYAAGGAYSPAQGFANSVYEVILMARQMVLATGHWSVWATILSAVRNFSVAPWSFLGPVGAEKLFRGILVQYFADEGALRLFTFQPEPPTVLPGTDPTRVP